MKHLPNSLFTLILLCVFTALRGQAGCPEDQKIVIPDTIDQVRFSLPVAEGDNCSQTSSVFTVSEATITSGLLKDAEVVLNEGFNEMTYYTCASFQEKVLDDVILLPDGDGADYRIPFTLSDYPEGTTVGDMSEPVLICATMEHSYLGDLDIWVECPDGTRWKLHAYGTSDSVRGQLLGEGLAQTMTPDSAYQYCWRSGAPHSLRSYVETFNVGNDESLPAGDYAPEDPVSVINDCAVNGEWALRIRDNIVRDNGSLAAWSVAFASRDGLRCNFTVEVKSEGVNTEQISAGNSPLLSVAPNPFGDVLSFSSRISPQSSPALLSVFSAGGRLMFSRALDPSAREATHNFDASGWPAGVYFLRLRTDSGEVLRKILRR